jgi:S-(hydroxymethyl)glutathione dehydrogenase/alcohol dehydrogenase
MKTYAAIAHHADAPFTLEEVDIADPVAGEVRVKTLACGICRSDLSALAGKETIVFPCVLGHEASGVVEAVGAGVRALKEGDAVILSWTPACGVCSGCLRGEKHLCEGVTMTTGGVGPLSARGRPLDRFMALGAFCAHMVVPQSMAIPVTSALPATQTCLIGCGVTTGFGAAVNTAAVCWGERVAVLGCGGVGLAAVQGARIAGAAEIYAIDPIAERRAAALRLGATAALEPTDTVKAVLSATRGGVDVAIECVGDTRVMQDCFRMTRSGGRSIVVGLPAYTDVLSIPAILLLREKSIKGSIYGSANPSIDFAKIVRLAERGQLDLGALVDRTRPFAEINEGFAEMRAGTLTRCVLTF